MEYKTYPCDVCLETDAVEVPNVREFTNDQLIHICKNCGFVYVKNRRSSLDIAKTWSDDISDIYTAYSPLMTSRHAYVAQFLNQKIDLKGKTVLDVGAGQGQFLRLIRDTYGASVFGVEPSKQYGKIMDNLEIDNFIGAFESYKGEQNSFDVITLLWTLENCSEPREIVKKAYRLLKPNGTLLLTTGSRLLVPYLKPLNRYLSHYPVDWHPSRFSRNSAYNLLSQFGFQMACNDFLNDGILCVSGTKSTDIDKTIELKVDKYQDLVDYFENWKKVSEKINSYYAS